MQNKFFDTLVLLVGGTRSVLYTL